MERPVRRLLVRVPIVLAISAGLALAALHAVTAQRLGRTCDVSPLPIDVPASSDRIEHGERLARVSTAIFVPPNWTRRRVKRSARCYSRGLRLPPLLSVHAATPRRSSRDVLFVARGLTRSFLVLVSSPHRRPEGRSA